VPSNFDNAPTRQADLTPTRRKFAEDSRHRSLNVKVKVSMDHSQSSNASLAHKRSLFRDERGLSTVEYVILMAVVVIGAIGAWNSIGTKFKTALTNSQTELESLN
jgi:Flp pilus assembly pilin Flp